MNTRFISTIAAVTIALFAAGTAEAHLLPHKPFKKMTLEEKESHQLKVIRHDKSVLRFYRNHRFLFGSHHRVIALADRRFHESQWEWTAKELKETRASIKRRDWIRARTLVSTNDWLTAVSIVQRVFPGSDWWLKACSSSEGGHGRWVYFERLSYPKYGSMRTPGGPMQYMQGTFWGDYRRAVAEARSRGFIIPADSASWYSMLGQAIAAGWAYHYNRPPGKWTGRRC